MTVAAAAAHKQKIFFSFFYTRLKERRKKKREHVSGSNHSGSEVTNRQNSLICPGPERTASGSGPTHESHKSLNCQNLTDCFYFNQHSFFSLEITQWFKITGNCVCVCVYDLMYHCQGEGGRGGHTGHTEIL